MVFWGEHKKLYQSNYFMYRFNIFSKLEVITRNFSYPTRENKKTRKIIKVLMKLVKGCLTNYQLNSKT